MDAEPPPTPPDPEIEAKLNRAVWFGLFGFLARMGATSPLGSSSGAQPASRAMLARTRKEAMVKNALALLVTALAIYGIFFHSGGGQPVPPEARNGLESRSDPKPEAVIADSQTRDEGLRIDQPIEDVEFDPANESSDSEEASEATAQLLNTVRATIEAAGLDPSVVDDAGPSGIEAIADDLSIFFEERQSAADQVNHLIRERAKEKLHQGDVEVVDDMNSARPLSGEHISRGSRAVNGRREQFIIRVFDQEVPDVFRFREQVRQIDHEIGTMAHALLWDYVRRR